MKLGGAYPIADPISRCRYNGAAAATAVSAAVAAAVVLQPDLISRDDEELFVGWYTKLFAHSGHHVFAGVVDVHIRRDDLAGTVVGVNLHATYNPTKLAVTHVRLDGANG